MDLDLPRDETRLPASLLVLVTVGTSGLLACAIPSAFIGLVSLIGGMYIYVWHGLYGRMLSRQIRALFDEANVLQSYQPRARTMGHLFEAELPTPVPTGSKTRNNEEEDNFRKMRDTHYAVEYQKILRLNKEKDRVSLEKAASSTASVQQQQPFSEDDLDDHTEGGEI